MSALGGRIAEDIVFKKVSTGAYSDFKYASRLARAMVCHYGMSEKLGPIVYDQHADFNYSADTARLIDQEVREMVESCYKKTEQLLHENRDKLDKLAQALLERETMGAPEIYELLGIPSRESHPIV